MTATIPGSRPAGRAGGAAQSWALLRAFRHETDDPETFYEMLADATVAQFLEVTASADLRVLDVGGGPGYLAEALRREGASCVSLDPSADELRLHGRSPTEAVQADGLRLPFPGETFDLCHASNVLEHVDAPWALLDEMIRVVVPGGLAWCSFTNWWSPWGGHETSPWHYLGAERALRRYERRHGHPPKNRFGASLFPVHVGQVIAWAKSHPDVDLVTAFPRYHPRWARAIVALPGVREVLTWNLSVVLRRRW